MQLIIDINDNEYMGIKRYPNNITSYPVTIHIYDAIRKGIPLEDALYKASLESWEKVKADIIAESDNKSNNMQFNLGLLAALAIINKHLQGDKK